MKLFCVISISPKRKIVSLEIIGGGDVLTCANTWSEVREVYNISIRLFAHGDIETELGRWDWRRL